MSQHITIKNFGPISDVTEMEVKDFMLFIGERATGKSTIAKSIFYFKSLRDDLVNFYLELLRSNQTDNKFNQFGRKAKERFYQYFGPSFSLPDNFYVKYSYSELPNHHIELKKGERGYLTLTAGSSFINGYYSIFALCVNFRSSNLNPNTSNFSDAIFEDFRRTLTERVGDLFGDNSRYIFIPAQRSLLTTLSGQTILDSVELDYLTGKFIKEINSVKFWINSVGGSIPSPTSRSRNISQGNAYSVLRNKSEGILKANYLIENGLIEYLVLNNGYRLRLNFTSSGQQESLWILNVLQFLLLSSQKTFIVIEEPESHLDPKTQKEIIEAVGYFAKQNGNKAVITTHSPYVLGALNNMIYANTIGSTYNSEVNEVLPSYFWMNTINVGAYETTNGTVSSIKGEDGLIINERLDRVSDDINRVYNSLFNIENQAENEL